MILVIDNRDSFVHNLARYIREAGEQTIVLKNTASLKECLSSDVAGVVISPGPGAPEGAGVSIPLIKALPDTLPLFGVCLGHQCLAEAFGWRTRHAHEPLHGEASDIRHLGRGLFDGVRSPTPVGRYHSLIAESGTGSAIIPTAWSERGEVMAIEHVSRPLFGVQFHPESILTPSGRQLIMNFVNICKRHPAS